MFLLQLKSVHKFEYYQTVAQSTFFFKATEMTGDFGTETLRNFSLKVNEEA